MLILASKSKTRKTLLSSVGLNFLCQTASVDERALESETRATGGGPKEVAIALSVAKAMAVSTSNPEAFVIGADQTLQCGTLEIHKPSTLADAARQLEALSGKPHQLHSGVALVKNGVPLFQHLDSADLELKPYSKARIEAVLALEGDAVLSSVGGYRLEGPSARLFQSVKGDYFTILGLPLLPLIEALEIHAPQVFGQKSIQGQAMGNQ